MPPRSEWREVRSAHLLAACSRRCCCCSTLHVTGLHGADHARHWDCGKVPTIPEQHVDRVVYRSLQQSLASSSVSSSSATRASPVFPVCLSGGRALWLVAVSAPGRAPHAAEHSTPQTTGDNHTHAFGVPSHARQILVPQHSTLHTTARNTTSHFLPELEAGGRRAGSDRGESTASRSGSQLP